MKVTVRRYTTRVEVLDVELPYYFKLVDDFCSSHVEYGKVEKEVTTVLEFGNNQSRYNETLLHVYRVPANEYSWVMYDIGNKIKKGEFDEVMSKFLRRLA